MPLCLGTSGSVRAIRIAQSLCWAPDVQTFWPFTTKDSPSRSARLFKPCKIGSGIRFREQLTPDCFAPQHRWELTALLLLGPVRNESRSGHADPDGERSYRYVVLGHFLIEDGLVPGGFATPAVFLGPGDGTPASFVEGALPLAAATYIVGMRGVPGPVSQASSDLCMLLEPQPTPRAGTRRPPPCRQNPSLPPDIRLGPRGMTTAGGRSICLRWRWIAQRTVTAQMASTRPNDIPRTTDPKPMVSPRTCSCEPSRGIWMRPIETAQGS